MGVPLQNLILFGKGGSPRQCRLLSPAFLKAACPLATTYRRLNHSQAPILSESRPAATRRESCQSASAQFKTFSHADGRNMAGRLQRADRCDAAGVERSLATGGGLQFGGDLNCSPGQVDLWGTLEVISSLDLSPEAATRFRAS